ncbi:hypothetical protein [Nocardia sienata]|nr:hypothetical protein [Nocardia sienata]
MATRRVITRPFGLPDTDELRELFGDPASGRRAPAGRSSALL